MYPYDYLEHHGILGQKWGIRRFQNPDGSLTAAGIKRYGGSKKLLLKATDKLIKEKYNQYNKDIKKLAKEKFDIDDMKKITTRHDLETKLDEEYFNTEKGKQLKKDIEDLEKTRDAIYDGKVFLDQINQINYQNRIQNHIQTGQQFMQIHNDFMNQVQLNNMMNMNMMSMHNMF